MEDCLQRAAQAIASSDALLVAAGAGMGVDSGLPDFRGAEGFWKAYPPFRQRGWSFSDLANPVWFDRDPAQAWGFYGHRYHLYDQTTPHQGFQLLRRWCQEIPDSWFVFTSNVDMHFQKSGFDPQRIMECHGSFSHLQCAHECCDATWSSERLQVDFDEASFRARDPLPTCRFCGGIARPNILMFNDSRWVQQNSRDQEHRMAAWLVSLPSSVRLTIVEIGAGTAVPSVRWQSEQILGVFPQSELIRINPREPNGPDRTISIAQPALSALREIEAALGSD